jgi:hypothetical protein
MLTYIICMYVYVHIYIYKHMYVFIEGDMFYCFLCALLHSEANYFISVH